jgi:hypothetical protein
MGSRKLEAASWQAYFDGLSRNLHGQSAEIEIAALALGNQVQADWLPLQGISYDPGGEVLAVLLEGLDHLVHHPREIHVDEGPAGLHSLLVIDDEGTRQIIRLREPLMLPAPNTAAS